MYEIGICDGNANTRLAKSTYNVLQYAHSNIIKKTGYTAGYHYIGLLEDNDKWKSHLWQDHVFVVSLHKYVVIRVFPGLLCMIGAVGCLVHDTHIR